MGYYIDKQAYFDSVGYKPHSQAQRSFHESKARFRIACCGRRFGKSKMVGTDRSPNYLLHENTVDWIVGPNYDLGEKEFRVIWDDLMVSKRLGLDKRVKRAYNKRTGDMFIQFPWGPRVEVRSAQHPETLVGEALDHVIMSEAAKHSAETWERYIRPALSDKRGGADMGTTPEGHNWLYQLWQFGRDPQYSGIYESWNFPTWLNTIYYPGGLDNPEIQLLKLTMSAEEFAQEIAADFSSFTGKIYGEFDENTHVQACTYNPAWKNYIAFDWGFTNPLAAIEFQVDPWDNIYIWREHYQRYKQLEEHLSIMRNREQPAGYKIDCCFGDAADPEATLYVCTHFAPCISEPLSKTNWRQGIDCVKRFLKLYQIGSDEWERPIEAPKLFVDHSCKNTIREFNTYKRKETNVDPNESNTAGAARKVDDHAMDALRYGLMHVFELGANSHLNEVMSPDNVWLPNEVPDFGTSDTIFSGSMRF